IPSYKFPETAAIALARATRYARWREQPERTLPEFADLRRDEAASIVASALQRGGGWLTAEETAALLSCYGLPFIEQKIVATPEGAGELAEEMDCEIALKVIAPGVLHKTEAGGVRLRLRGQDQGAAAATEIRDRLTAQGNPPTGFV